MLYHLVLCGDLFQVHQYLFLLLVNRCSLEPKGLCGLPDNKAHTSYTSITSFSTKPYSTGLSKSDSLLIFSFPLFCSSSPEQRATSHFPMNNLKTAHKECLYRHFALERTRETLRLHQYPWSGHHRKRPFTCTATRTFWLSSPRLESHLQTLFLFSQ